MKEIVGYAGTAIMVLAVAALIVNALMQKRKNAGDASGMKQSVRQKKGKKTKRERAVKAPADMGFAVPGASAPQAAPRADFGAPAGAVSGRAAYGTVLMDQASGDPAGSVLMDEPPACGASLRCIGAADLPARIPVILRGQAFTVGRVDVVLGHAQSDFEFPAETKAVSRRHAAISCDGEGYIIQDLGSKAGTFVNGVRLQSQVLYRLENGSTVSFGTGGADYIWEA